MKNFEFASPRAESEAVGLLNDHGGRTAVLAGGTDLIGLLQADLAAPERVVDIRNVKSMTGIREESDGIWVGALTTLDEVLAHPLLKPYLSLGQVADAHHAIQIQSSGTLGGDLCHMPNCWYYRNGYGLLAMKDGESLVETGENRYHAILGNRGPAKFVNASRFAPALIAWGAKVRIIGPGPEESEVVPLEYFYISPKSANQGNTILKPGQLISHIWLPAPKPTMVSAAYEVLQLEGLDWPLAAASVMLDVEAGIVRSARVVLGHVAPVPWVSQEAASMLRGQSITPELAQAAGTAAVARATPLSNNEYKVQIARTAVKRAILKAVDQLEGGL
ncbi:MAG: Molybdopterin dehydrogenase [Planctomycetaceae bacterium]|nr:Molybdopterin dehydrogenase [Planctomycetaceae bacterium]